MVKLLTYSERVKEQQQQRLDLIHEFFMNFEEKWDCSIQLEGDYVNFSENRLIEHIIYWYLDFRLKRRELNKQWKNIRFRNHLVQEFKKDPFNRYYLDQLF